MQSLCSCYQSNDAADLKHTEGIVTMPATKVTPLYIHVLRDEKGYRFVPSHDFSGTVSLLPKTHTDTAVAEFAMKVLTGMIGHQKVLNEDGSLDMIRLADLTKSRYFTSEQLSLLSDGRYKDVRFVRGTSNSRQKVVLLPKSRADNDNGMKMVA